MNRIAGDCRLSPPQIIQVCDYPGESHALTAWPTTKGGQWCGEFEDRPDDHVTELPDSWEHISEPVGRVIEKSCDAYGRLNSADDEIA